MPGKTGQSESRDRSTTTNGFPLPSQLWHSVGQSLRLSNRELQIVRGIFDGGSEASIARDLDLSSHTIHSHLDRLYRKLHVSNRCALAVRVFSEYLKLHPPDRDSRQVSSLITTGFLRSRGRTGDGTTQ